jgi:phospholipid/cholesterol/gamma-HCH transport system ATP-binding protein
VALARCVILGSKIIFCDEPTSGLDPIRSRDISNLIKDVSRQMGCTTVITSHDIVNSLRIADRVGIIHDRKLAALGRPEELEKNDNEFIREFMHI